MPIKLKFWLFFLVVMAQLSAALYMPIRAKIIRANGQMISLQLAPVDPYDMMTGYSMDLWYKVSQLNSYPPLKSPPYQGQTLYATLKRGDKAVWDPIALSTEYPSSVKPGEVVLKGEYDVRGWSSGVWFGVEKMYIPADRREEIESTMTQARLRTWDTRSPQPSETPADFARADVVVDSQGNASLIALHIGDAEYR